jgi:hypothetical protein
MLNGARRSVPGARDAGAEAASLVGRSTVTVRAWCRLKHEHLGVYDKSRHLWKVNREQLKHFYIERFGADQLPAHFR